MPSLAGAGCSTEPWGLIVQWNLQSEPFPSPGKSRSEGEEGLCANAQRNWCFYWARLNKELGHLNSSEGECKTGVVTK